jgi:acetamidase/formamidase
MDKHPARPQRGGSCYLEEFPMERARGEWDVDGGKGTATLVQPETRLRRLTLPLRPMLGCFGVAPPGGQAISTATSAEHGGNMDYNGLHQGVSVYFPRVRARALFL